MTSLSRQSTRLRDLIEEELSAHDIREKPTVCPYDVGERVLLRHSDQRQKWSTSFEQGWQVKKDRQPVEHHHLFCP